MCRQRHRTTGKEIQKITKLSRAFQTFLRTFRTLERAMIQSPACYSGALFSIVEDEQKKIRGRVSSRVSSCLTMPKGVLCKFFVHGACLKGEYCEFSHDWKDQPNNVCTFYQKGVCIYGARCRYDHVKVSRSSSSISSSSSILCSSSITHPSSSASKGETVNLSGAPVELSALSKPFSPSSRPAWNQGFIDFAIPENGFDGNSTASRTADQPICAFAAGGRCPNGDNCPQMHGDLCSTCGKHCLHPYRPDEREEHINQCQINKKRLEALRHSQEIECSVCLERVLSKGTPAERKFGILSECDHPFCISCIRNWRSNSPSSGMDVNTALRACPICRKLSYFVIPSVIWYSSKEEKQEILDSYKNKLRSIDCKHFDFGNGRCPFGTSCFYKHAYRDGRIEEVTLRHLGAEDGNTVIAKDIRVFRANTFDQTSENPSGSAEYEDPSLRQTLFTEPYFEALRLHCSFATLVETLA